MRDGLLVRIEVLDKAETTPRKGISQGGLLVQSVDAGLRVVLITPAPPPTMMPLLLPLSLALILSISARVVFFTSAFPSLPKNVGSMFPPCHHHT